MESIKQIVTLERNGLFETNIYSTNDFQNTRNVIYSSSMSSGSSVNQKVSYQVALSEYLERKAYSQISISEKKEEFGFDLVRNSTGMAAHWWGFKARRNAKYEALERWTLHHWWNDLLSFERVKTGHPHRTVLSKVYKQFNTTVVLICDYREESGFFYGFAAHKNYEKAYNKALVELDRNHRVLTYYYKKKPELSEFREKRVVYFSSSEGFSEFSKKVRKNEFIKDLVFPELYLDKEIPGPWQKWRRVWRVLFKQHIPQDYQNLNVFMF